MNSLVLYVIYLILVIGIGYGIPAKRDRHKHREKRLSTASLDAIARVERRLENHVFNLTKECSGLCIDQVRAKLGYGFNCSHVVYLKQLHVLECSNCNCTEVQDGRRVVARIPEVLGIFRNEPIGLPINESVTDPYVELNKMKNIQNRDSARISGVAREIDFADVTWKNWHLDRIDQFAGVRSLLDLVRVSKCRIHGVLFYFLTDHGISE